MKVQALLVAFGALSLSACAVEDKQPNCKKLERYIEGRERGLERSCRVDDDCKVVFIRPDRPIAASELPDDPELQRVLDAYYGRTAAALVEVPEGAVRPDTRRERHHDRDARLHGAPRAAPAPAHRPLRTCHR